VWHIVITVTSTYNEYRCIDDINADNHKGCPYTMIYNGYNEVSMRYDPDKHHRRSIRLNGYDYQRPGAYFVTICVQGRARLFGNVVEGEMRHNAAGQMVASEWEGLVERFSGIALDAYVVMPDHFHAIIMLADVPTPDTQLGDVIGAFKSLTTNRYIRAVRDFGWPPFDRQLWQRNYYEHIIRDEADLERIRVYIQSNPARWRARLRPAKLAYRL
jgi:REP element-mobilizing transposase RayT